MKNAKYLKVEAQMLYWHHTTINGETSETGDNIPFKKGNMWFPTIDIESGVVMDWPPDTEASFHFKVCDPSTYYLLNQDSCVIASRYDNVPDGLCHVETGFTGYGDYIIFRVGSDGKIFNYKNQIDYDDFESVYCFAQPIV